MSADKNIALEETFKLAIKNHQENKLDVAQNLYNQVLKIDPSHAHTLNNLGVLFKDNGEYQKAKNYCEKAIEIAPKHADAHNNLGIVLHQLQMNEKAKICFEKAIEINPNNVNAHYNLGLIFQGFNEYQKAKDCYEKAIEIDPDYATAHNNLGIIFQTSSEYQKAKICYEKAIEINPNYADAFFNLGAVLNELGELKKTIDCYQKAVALMPQHQDSHYNLGVVLYATTQYKNAAEQFKLTDFKNSKSFLLSCLYNLDNKSNFFKELDDQIKQGETNAMIGSLSSRSEIKYGITKPNPFCADPLKYSLKIDLTEQYDFKNIFIDPIRDALNEGIFFTRKQDLLKNGEQTVGNLFAEKNNFLGKIKDIIHLEIDRYRIHFKESKEGLIKSWPKSYNINGWLVSMKNGGKLAPHMHDYGWLSGSVYINVPQNLKADSGNLVLCIDNQESEVEKNINPKKIIDVVTGSLCLFPSSLYHYTIPFDSKEDRIVLAFDMMPN